jgi:hypothetical protein
MQQKTYRNKWNSSMTDRERFNAQMHYRSVDRCFNTEFGFWQENYHQWPLFKDNNITGHKQAHEFLGMDKIETIGGSVWMNPGFERKVIGETENKQIIQDDNGVKGEIPKDGHSTIPHYTDPAVKTPEDWYRIKKERFRINIPQRTIDIEKLQKEHPADRDYPLGVSCGSMIGKIRDLLTLQGLAYAVYDYPDMVEDMVETCCLLAEHSLDQLLPHFDFDFACGWEDISCNSGPLISMDFFQKVIVPRYKRIGKKLREFNIDIWYTDSDGDIRAMIPGFLQAGLNTMFPWEVNGCKHPGKSLDKYGKDLRIMGGVDKMVLRAGKEAIQEYLESLTSYVKRGGFIPHCDHRCPPDVTPENYLYYLDIKEQLFGMQ